MVLWLRLMPKNCEEYRYVLDLFCYRIMDEILMEVKADNFSFFLLVLLGWLRDQGLVERYKKGENSYEDKGRCNK